jgi:Na+-transporting methylmalonyl-CoA/oxaloacetate decarboxylase gamma subunit
LSELSQGLMISIAGLALAFIFMAVFMLVIIILQKLFPPKPLEEEGTGGEVEEQPVTMITTVEGEEESIVAAIAVAIRFAQSTK